MLDFWTAIYNQLPKGLNCILRTLTIFLNKIKKIDKLPEGAIFCTMDVAGLYPNIPHGEGLASLYKFLKIRENKQISSDTSAELAEIVLKNNI